MSYVGHETGSTNVNGRLKRIVGWLVAGGSLAIMVVGLWPQATTIDPEVRAQRLATRIACPWCDGQSLAESGADVAGDLRLVLRQKVDAGWTDEEILGFFATRYGDQILLDPPWLGRGMALWASPALALLAGASIVVRQRVKHANAK